MAREIDNLLALVFEPNVLRKRRASPEFADACARDVLKTSTFTRCEYLA